MQYSRMKKKLLGMFDENKLVKTPREWGFFHESERDVKRLGYCTNLTEETIEEARKEKIDFLLTHHDSWEFVFGLKEACNQLLRDYNIIHAFFHGPLDDAAFGTSASLAKAIGMFNCKRVMPYEDVYCAGLIGEVLETGFQDFALRLKDILQEDIRCFCNNRGPVRKAAVAAGGGNMTTEMRIAAEAGCDTYITGEYALYSQQYARHAGMSLLVGSHTNTEILGVKSMAEGLARETDIKIIRLPEAND